MEDIYGRIQKILKENYDIEQISPEQRLKADLGLNSFDLMELVCIAEETLGIEIEEGKYRQIETVGQMCDYIESVTKEAGL